MTRRVPLPGASELFRTTARSASDTPAFATPQDTADNLGSGQTPPQQRAAPAGEPAGTERAARPRATGRRKHDTKITVYLSGEELLALEQARLSLRAEHGLSVDRGRIVREAIGELVSDFEDNGGESMLVQRLRRTNEG